MPIVALVAYAVYVALAFGWRAAVHYRATGTTGFVGVTGRVGSIDWLAGALFALAVTAAAAAPAAQLLGLVPPWSGAAPQLGLACFAIGLVGTLSAQLVMGASWRVGVDHAAKTDLVARGPFRWIRNPIYTWMTLTYAGLVLIAPNALAVAAFATLLIALEVQVRAVEEPHLLRTHGDAYRRYAAATGRFVPGLGRLG